MLTPLVKGFLLERTEQLLQVGQFYKAFSKGSLNTL